MGSGRSSTSSIFETSRLGCNKYGASSEQDVRIMMLPPAKISVEPVHDRIVVDRRTPKRRARGRVRDVRRLAGASRHPSGSRVALWYLETHVGSAALCAVLVWLVTLGADDGCLTDLSASCALDNGAHAACSTQGKTTARRTRSAGGRERAGI